MQAYLLVPRLRNNLPLSFLNQHISGVEVCLIVKILP